MIRNEDDLMKQQNCFCCYKFGGTIKVVSEHRANTNIKLEQRKLNCTTYLLLLTQWISENKVHDSFLLIYGLCLYISIILSNEKLAKKR